MSLQLTVWHTGCRVQFGSPGACALDYRRPARPPLLLILGVLRLIGAPSEQFSLTGLAVMLILWIGYGSVLESSPWQATLGKRLIGLRVYDLQAGRLTPFRAVGRNLVKDGPFLASVLRRPAPFSPSTG
jgi:uncharacterized RDD family membrane protein YckC